MNADFRHDLKARTQAEHDRVDAALSALNLAVAPDFIRFLSLHRACFGAMVQACTHGSAMQDTLNDICTRIDDDLHTLGAPPVASLPVDLGRVDPLALDYMLEGSRLGSKVLRRAWVQSDDVVVRKAGRYFATPAPVERWRAVCAKLSDIDADSPRAACIVADAKRLFGLFTFAPVVRDDRPVRQAV
ncbi:hypothetical protein EU805_16140 [Salipiger sp. IMCC34102]|uniref:biliverdin-producing heme oxygenase n=1 Tax=Salipiger sp. IMCC34102 TaxID=2510647 RepID=UPI00101D5ED2|nr:biliverdin-producing heme oxygenase [Salipiger sp. IMCC34102]RYH00985.1 hypothetical protein EU805_16140 [Salipiger sp. IMCC34102]